MLLDCFEDIKQTHEKGMYTTRKSIAYNYYLLLLLLKLSNRNKKYFYSCFLRYTFQLNKIFYFPTQITNCAMTTHVKTPTYLLSFDKISFLNS